LAGEIVVEAKETVPVPVVYIRIDVTLSVGVRMRIGSTDNPIALVQLIRALTV
jgi:hypothetical protein